MNAAKIISFLKDLSKNNNKEWFHENKWKYEEAKKEFETFINTIIPEVSKFDKDIKDITAKDCLFRIYNDIRFAKNKPLYKTNFGGFIAKGGKNGGHAGYYFHIEPGGCFIGGGIYMPPSDKLKAIKKEIYYNYKEFSGILSNKDFKKYFKELSDIKTSRVPSDFPKDFEGAELLKYKSYTIIYPMTIKQILSPELNANIIKVFKALMPLNKFINQALYQ
jgi:uncharacterized protein (TIGR02453 family)